MTSWVLAISPDFPDHWEIAKRSGFWDLRKSRKIRAGDVVYFWRSGASFAGRVEVVEDAREIKSRDTLPWRDAATTKYQQRFTFTGAQDPVSLPKWGEVADATGIRQWVGQAPHSDDPAVERALRSYFEEPGHPETRWTSPSLMTTLR